MSLFGKRKIFLDFAAGEDNPSAIYAEGLEAKKKLEDARTRVARLIHVQARDVIFTSGGTESDNMAILGVFEEFRKDPPAGGKKPHIIISSVEHPAIVESAREVERRGGEVTIVEVGEDGRVNPQEVIDAVKASTILISIALADGESGAIQPVSKIGRLLRERRKDKETSLPYLHTDASQAMGFLDLDMEALRVDLMTLDSSKVSGPRGVGCLVVRPNVRIHPIIFGGEQERGLRAGTENVPAISAFAHAFQSAIKNRMEEYARLGELRKYFIKEIKVKIPNVIISGGEDSDYQLPNIVSISIPDVLAEFTAIKLADKGIAISVGSACNSRKNEPDKESVRFSFGRSTTKHDLVRALGAL